MPAATLHLIFVYSNDTYNTSNDESTGFKGYKMPVVDNVRLLPT